MAKLTEKHCPCREPNVQKMASSRESLSSRRIFLRCRSLSCSQVVWPIAHVKLPPAQQGGPSGFEPIIPSIMVDTDGLSR